MDHPDGAHPELASFSQSSLPQVGMSEIFGLIELLRAKGGREDIYKLASELQMEFGQTLTVIRAAELLHFVNTPDGDVVLEGLGESATRAKINQRKLIVRDQLGTLPLFGSLKIYLDSKDDRQATKEEILQKARRIPPQ